MDILAFAQSNSAITIKGNANVSSGSREIDVRVDQTNILIGTHSFVRGMPVLEVATDDVVGGHSCKMHRISGEGLFYLESHGIDTKHAEIMLIQSEVWKRLHIIAGTESAAGICAEIFDQLRSGSSIAPLTIEV